MVRTARMAFDDYDGRERGFSYDSGCYTFSDKDFKKLRKSKSLAKKVQEERANSQDAPDNS